MLSIFSGSAFAAMFVNADPEKIDNIIGLLQKLIDEANHEIEVLRVKKDDAKKNYTDALELKNAKENNCIHLKNVLKNATAALNVATAKFNKSEEAFTQAEPGIQDEIATIEGIITTLSQLTAINNPGGRSILSGSISPIAL